MAKISILLRALLQRAAAKPQDSEGDAAASAAMAQGPSASAPYPEAPEPIDVEKVFNALSDDQQTLLIIYARAVLAAEQAGTATDQDEIMLNFGEILQQEYSVTRKQIAEAAQETLELIRKLKPEFMIPFLEMVRQNTRSQSPETYRDAHSSYNYHNGFSL